MASTDALIDELFPNQSSNASKPKTRSSFDDSDDDAAPPKAKPQTTAAASATGQPSVKAPTKTNNSFDDSDSGEDEEHAARHTSFPSLASVGTASHDHCVVSNIPEEELHDVYARQRYSQLESVGGLLGTAGMNSTSGAQLSLKMNSALAKRYPFAAYLNAFHITHPASGNGVDPEKGSAFILCLKCDHVVVRLQDAKWLDAQQPTSPNLYLSTRYYYPDWCRFLTESHAKASSQSSPTQSGNLVIRTPPKDGKRWSAYCCQCSWLSVGVQNVHFQTTMLDVARVRNQNPEEVKFATWVDESNVDSVSSGKSEKRLPLWVARGLTPK